MRPPPVGYGIAPAALSRCAPFATAPKPLRLRKNPPGPAAPLGFRSAPGLSHLLPGAPRFWLAATVVAAAVVVAAATAAAVVVTATAAAAATVVVAAPAVPVAAAAAQQEDQDDDPPAAPAETTIVTTTHDFVTSLKICPVSETGSDVGFPRRRSGSSKPTGPAAGLASVPVSGSYYAAGGKGVPAAPPPVSPGHPIVRSEANGRRQTRRPPRVRRPRPLPARSERPGAL